MWQGPEKGWLILGKGHQLRNGESRDQDGPHCHVTLEKTSYFSGPHFILLSIGNNNVQVTTDLLENP